MKIIMDNDIKELIETGYNRKYRTVAKNTTLYVGLMRAYQILESAHSVEDLKLYSFLHYEKLKYNYYGFSSVRLDNRYVHRLIFQEKADCITLQLIEIDSTHYGNKK